jgi:hypothetical protein
MNPLFIYMGAIGLLLAILIAVAIIQIRPTRPCPQCDTRVDMTQRRCKFCGYDFSPVRQTR